MQSLRTLSRVSAAFVQRKHYHAGNDEIRYILSGSATMWVGHTSGRSSRAT